MVCDLEVLNTTLVVTFRFFWLNSILYK